MTKPVRKKKTTNKTVFNFLRQIKQKYINMLLDNKKHFYLLYTPHTGVLWTLIKQNLTVGQQEYLIPGKYKGSTEVQKHDM